MSAHDVRKLRVCPVCGGLGLLPEMLALPIGPTHGRCATRTLPRDELLALPAAELGKLRVNDIDRNMLDDILERIAR